MGVENSKKFSSQHIAQYYDVSEDHYTYFWDLNKSHSLHYGYWDPTVKNFREALAKINQVLAEKAKIGKGTTVLDAGCGVGGSVLWLAKNKEAIVTGITLSNKQAARANQSIKQSGLENQARIDVQDFTKTTFDTASFDVVWAIESVCHAENKNAFIQEAWRLLKPGGRIILADFFVNADAALLPADQKAIDTWAHGWAVPFFEKKNNFISMLKDAGFTSVETSDITENILPSAKRLYYAFFPGWVGSRIYNFFHKGTTDFSKNNVYTAYHQYETLKKGLWSYYIVFAQK
ncbi:MAG: SAM-dependent methyltransferase [Cytophaga sp.]|uniref:SAM-dependent methyltransferase n=1 Tax=Cytophaga sp. TaxID=29535 RepID=UPI003F805992